jgi:hypothetical protein
MSPPTGLQPGKVYITHSLQFSTIHAPVERTTCSLYRPGTMEIEVDLGADRDRMLIGSEGW